MTDHRKQLQRHHNATIGLFVAFWIFTIGAILAIELIGVPATWNGPLIGTISGAAIVAVLLQFAAHCPGCGANLGWQRRLGIPPTCRKCGETLRS